MATVTRVRWLHPLEPFEETYDLHDPEHRAAYDANAEMWAHEVLSHDSPEVDKAAVDTRQALDLTSRRLASGRLSQAQLDKLLE